jgi:S-adenosylmethionine/arginine decarboxylase-like enzyme
MHGLHLIADLHDCACPAERLTDRLALAARCSDACRRHGLTVVAEVFHAFAGETACSAGATGSPAPASHRSDDGNPPHGQSGVTGAVVLAESHLAIHTWPELRGVTLDVYVCNFSADNSQRARTLFAELIADFAPGRQSLREVLRGQPN